MSTTWTLAVAQEVGKTNLVCRDATLVVEVRIMEPRELDRRRSHISHSYRRFISVISLSPAAVIDRSGRKVARRIRPVNRKGAS